MKNKSILLETTEFIDLNKIHLEWEKDSTINDLELDKESLKLPSLHSKYLRYYDAAKDQLRAAESNFQKLTKLRTLWYEGLLSKDKMDELQWKYDPFDGHLAKTKQQKDIYIKSDEFLISIKKEMDYFQNIVDSLKEMLSNITWRHQTIRNAIEFRKFIAGS